MNPGFLFKTFLLISLLYEARAVSTELPEKSVKITEVPVLVSPLNQSKTTSELLREQAEAIKQIVAAKKSTPIDYPTVTRGDLDIKPDPKTKEEKERESIEELRLKCKHLFKVANAEIEQPQPEATTPLATAIPFGPVQRPEFFKQRLPVLPLDQNSGSFYIFDSNPSAENQTPNQNYLSYNNAQLPSGVDNTQIAFLDVNKKPAHPQQEQSVKYVKLEPVIMQRTLVSNGRNYFYWYRTAPSNYQESTQFEITTSSTTSTTEKPTAAPGPQQHFKHELRFVVPYPYSNSEKLQYPYQIDPYAYYPKQLQPTTMSVQVPYVPNFQMVRTLSVPRSGEEEVVEDKSFKR